VAEDGNRLGVGGGKGLIDQVAGEPPVGEHLRQRRHHVGLGHHRQAGQVGRLQPVEVDPGQAPAVEGRMGDGVGQQAAQPVLPGSLELLGVPAQPLQVLGNPGEQCRLELSAQPLPTALLGGRGHWIPPGPVASAARVDGRWAGR
jgi:hypothetical protein